MMIDMEPLKQEKELLVEPEWERASRLLCKKTTDVLAFHQAEQEMKEKMQMQEMRLKYQMLQKHK
eukprot:15325171-Ditylum_brightwellii.AAC.1